MTDYSNLRDSKLRAAAQEAIAKVAYLWRQKDGLAALRSDGGLQYENYNNCDGIGHFRVGQGPRISCKPEGESLVLRHVGAHDDVNKNP